MSRLHKTKNWAGKHRVASGLILVVGLFIVYKIFGSATGAQETFTVKTGDVTQKVIVNGKTKAVHAVNLGFESSGTVSATYVDVGTRVVLGQKLVALESGELYANLLKAEANVASENARLDELSKGTRPEEIIVAQTEVSNAETVLLDAEKSLKDKVVDIINNNVDQLFSNPHSSNPQLNLTIANPQLVSDVNFKRVQIESILNKWVVQNGESNLPEISSFVENVALAVNGQNPSSSVTQTTIDGYKTSMSSAKSSITSAREKINSAKSTLTLAQNNLTLKKNGSTAEVISAQSAKVKQNEAQLQSAKVQLSKTVLYSPQNGIVTIQEAKVGETVTPGKSIISIISDSNLELESNVSEISIGKVAIGNPVNITFDAFPGDVFTGTVTYIEPAETIIDGVVNYKVTVAFNRPDPRIKSGLTSKLDIITGIKKAVTIVPQYSLITTNNETYVSRKNGSKFEQVPVKIGLRGEDGMVEVVSGLSTGDVIDMVAPAK